MFLPETLNITQALSSEKPISLDGKTWYVNKDSVLIDQADFKNPKPNPVTLSVDQLMSNQWQVDTATVALTRKQVKDRLQVFFDSLNIVPKPDLNSILTDLGF